jgi:hypothetical protein
MDKPYKFLTPFRVEITQELSSTILVWAVDQAQVSKQMAGMDLEDYLEEGFPPTTWVQKLRTEDAGRIKLDTYVIDGPAFLNLEDADFTPTANPLLDSAHNPGARENMDALEDAGQSTLLDP